MSRRGDAIKLRKRLDKRDAGREEKRNLFFGRLGDGAGNVKVSSAQPNLNYVRVPGRGVIRCQNTKVAARNDLDVALGYSAARPNTLQVLDIWDDGMADLGDRSYVPHHHQAHELNNPRGGDDVVWTDKQQVTPLLALPTDPPTMTVNIFGDVYPYLTGWNRFTATVSANLAGHVPAGVWNARYTLISIECSTNTLRYDDGGVFVYVPVPPDPYVNIPAPPVIAGGVVPLVAVFLPNGITQIGLDNLVDVRLFNIPMGGSMTPAPTPLLTTSAHSDTANATPPAQGSVVAANATPAWDELVIGVNLLEVLRVNAGGTDPEWGECDLTVLSNYLRGNIIKGGAADWDTLAIGANALEVLRVNAGVTDPEWGECDLTVLSDWAQGRLIVGGGADWTTLAVGAVNSVLWSDGADPQWSATPTLDGLTISSGGDIDPTDAAGQNLGDATHRWDLYTQEVIFGGATGTNVIVVPDDVADALSLEDAGGFTYLTVVSTDADNYLQFDLQGGGNITIGEGTGADPHFVMRLTHNYAGRTYYGLTNTDADGLAGVSLTNDQGTATFEVWGSTYLAHAYDNYAVFYSGGDLNGLIFATGGAGDPIIFSPNSVETARITESNLLIASGMHLDPADASGQDLGDATHRWDLYTQEVAFGGASGANFITIPDDAADALHVSDLGGLEFLRIISTDANPYVSIDPGAAGINFGIGTSTPGWKLDVRDNVADYVALFFNDGNSADRAGPVVQAGKDDGTGQTYYYMCLDGDGTTVGYLWNNNTVFELVDASDAKFKTNIRDADIDGLGIVQQIRVRDYEPAATPTGATRRGFVAQELRTVYPDAVAISPEGDLGVSKSALIPVLVKAVQQLAGQVAELEGRLN